MTDENVPNFRLCSSPTDLADLDLHKFAIRNGFRMENGGGRYRCTSPSYVIEVSNRTRNSEIVEMLVENFLHDETLIKSLRINAGEMNEEEENRLKMDELLMMETVVETGRVLLAIHKETNRISGAMIIMVYKRSEEEEEEEEEEGSNDQLQGPINDKKSDPYEGRLQSRVMKDFRKYIVEMLPSEDQEDEIIFGKNKKCKFYAEIELIGVNKSDRSKGLGFDLYKAGLSYIREYLPKVTLLSGIYTSTYSKRIAEKIGKSPVYTFDVTRLKDDSGKPIFQDTPPHNHVTIMTMEIL